MSSLTICSIAAIARWARAGSGSASSLGSAVGMICQDRPNRSLSQPHWLSTPPPSSRRAHSRSTSSWSSQLTEKETASVNGNSGPPLSARYSCPRA